MSGRKKSVTRKKSGGRTKPTSKKSGGKPTRSRISMMRMKRELNAIRDGDFHSVQKFIDKHRENQSELDQAWFKWKKHDYSDPARDQARVDMEEYYKAWGRSSESRHRAAGIHTSSSPTRDHLEAEVMRRYLNDKGWDNERKAMLAFELEDENWKGVSNYIENVEVCKIPMEIWKLSRVKRF